MKSLILIPTGENTGETPVLTRNAKTAPSQRTSKDKVCAATSDFFPGIALQTLADETE
jgi:hypothetical protein